MVRTDKVGDGYVDGYGDGYGDGDRRDIANLADIHVTHRQPLIPYYFTLTAYTIDLKALHPSLHPSLHP